jgi:hypothetical protein
VPYAGPTLKPGHLYTWTVRTWNNDNLPGSYSDPQLFVTALKDTWTAKPVWGAVPTTPSSSFAAHSNCRTSPSTRRLPSSADATPTPHVSMSSASMSTQLPSAAARPAATAVKSPTTSLISPTL